MKSKKESAAEYCAKFFVKTLYVEMSCGWAAHVIYNVLFYVGLHVFFMFVFADEYVQLHETLLSIT